jgi:hypothetical protein
MACATTPKGPQPVGPTAAVYAANLFDCVSFSDIVVSVPLVSASDQRLLAPIVRGLRLHCHFSLRAWREIFGTE